MSPSVMIGDLQIKQFLTVYTNASLASKICTLPFNVGNFQAGLCGSLKVLSVQKLVTAHFLDACLCSVFS